MDEDAFRAARAELSPVPCMFEKALLSRCADCSQAQRRNIAEREAVACRSIIAQTQCGELRALLRANSAFSLKMIADAPIPHAKDIKVQCGGLLGLQTQLGVEAGYPPIANVYALVVAAAKRYGSFEQLPYGEIVQSVVAYEPRRRRSS